jgi:hypothetical protein
MGYFTYVLRTENEHLVASTDPVSQYAPTIFGQAGIPSQTASFLASGVSAILMLVFSIPATLLADKWVSGTGSLLMYQPITSSFISYAPFYSAWSLERKRNCRDLLD